MKLINILSDNEIKRYSELFKQPISVVKSLASMYDDLIEFQKNLYELDEDYIPEDDEPEDDINSEIKEKIDEFLPLIKEKIANQIGIDPEDIDGSLKIMKINPNILAHICPFIEKEKRDKIDCKFCPLYSENFIRLIIEMSNAYNIPIEQAAEQLKFNIYHFTDKTYKQILEDMANYNSNHNPYGANN